MSDQFVIKTKTGADLNVNPEHDKILLNYLGNNKTMVLLQIMGNPIKGYTLNTTKGEAIKINADDVAKFTPYKDVIESNLKKFNKKLYIFIGVVFVLFLIIAVGTSEETSTETISKSDSSLTTQLEKDLGYNHEEFKDRFNSATSVIKTDLSIPAINVEEGEVNNTFTTKLNDYSNIVGVISKQNGKVKSLTYIGIPNEDPKSSIGIIIGMGIMINASNPSLNATERGEILKKLGLLDKGVDLNDFQNSTIVGDIKYSIFTSTVTGIAFIIEPSN